MDTNGGSSSSRASLENEPEIEPVEVMFTVETYNRRFRVHGLKTVFKFNIPPDGVSEIEWLRRGFNDLIEQMKSEAQPGDYLGLTLKSLNLKRQDPGYIGFQPANQVNGNDVWGLFGGIIQSNAQSITSCDTFKVEVTRINLPVGSGGNRKRPGYYNNFSEECISRKGIITIKNSDNLCLPRALVVGKAHAKKNPLLAAIRMNKGNRQTIRAKTLMAKARVVIPQHGAGIPELEKFQDHLRKYKITVYNYGTKGREVYFEGDNPDANLKINLLYHEGHYNVITSLTGAFSCDYYCQACHVPYEKRGEHRCSNICSACLTVTPPCKLEQQGIVCEVCNLTFKNEICYMAHKKGCKNFKKCLQCEKVISLKKRKSTHFCGEVFCNICMDFKEPSHRCYMQVDTKRPKEDNFVFVFFDFETRQDEYLNDEMSTKVHKVNLCVSQQYCMECLGGNDQDCENCGSRTSIFNSNPVKDFLDYLLELRKHYKTVCCVAHNNQGFDCQFIFKEILENTKFIPETIMRGTKIILMKIDVIRFIDSLNYFAMALSALPKAFGLPAEKKKGFFPHLFNTIQNQNYQGPMPAKEFYCPDSMFEQSSVEFNKWHDEQIAKGFVFNFKKELVEYCISDVEILAQACLKFRSSFLEQTNVDPFLEATTIASACNLAFRRNFLKPNTIGLIPKKGYRLVDTQSAIALQWLTWEEDQRGVHIQHSGRGREVKICGVKVDGYDGQRVYEFHGCYYHGCSKCFPYKREERLKDDPSDSLHYRLERTKAKIAKLKNGSYEVIEMWECEFNNIKKDKKLKYLETLPILNTIPLNPRDAFFGGRTGNAKTYHKCRDGEKIQYVDVCSLYPYVCKYGKYPIGHPKIHVGDRECRKIGLEVEGLMKCKVLPPSDLYHPVLPSKMNKKLMFVLCQSCGENLNPIDCEHSSEERALVGTWTMDEIRKAVSKGYVILDIYEMWEYEVATYENGGLFTDFINKFLKLKQEASGYPTWCVTDEDRAKYINDYFEHEGILMDSSKITKNAGLRSLTKLILNSFWGKLGQRQNQPKTQIVRDPKELFDLVTSPEVQLNTLQEINAETLLANWEYQEEVGGSLKTVNVVLAAFTTSQARLKLYEHLEVLQTQVLYYDTDSVIYVQREGQHTVPTGDYLGQMTDELADYGEGSYISEFVSGGPKTYAYKVISTKNNETKTVCKVKGLTLNLKSSKQVNFETLKDMIISEQKTPIQIDENRIRRTKDRNIVTVKESKLFKITGPKRRHEGEFDTLPYGYKKRKL